MRWEGAEESGNVEDRRGMQRTGVAIGGGGALVLLILGMIFGVDLRPLAQQVQQQGGGPVEKGGPPGDRTGKFAAAVLKFTEDVWAEQFRKAGERPYEPPGMVLFEHEVDTGCGTAPSAVGPFYCPADKTVYLDPTFFAELEDKLGGSKAEFSQAYVIAHEVGHHVQNLLGYNRRLKEFERSEQANAGIRLELQADYLAGVWAKYGQEKFKFIEPGDVEAALTTARAIGDDRIQKKTRRWVSPESFTHGTAEQRLRYFRQGLETGDFSKRKLDTFFNPNVSPLKL